MKQISNTKNSLVLSSPLLHSINPRRLFRKYRLVLLLACITLFISSCNKEDNDCKKTVPFKAVFQVIVVNSPDNLIADVTGTGKGSPIGKSTFVGHAVFVGPESNITGHGTITAENGDQIFETAIEGPGPSVDTITGNILLIYRAKITGGTGKYEGATGSYTDVAHASIYTPAGIDSLKGTITIDECNGKSRAH